MGMLNQLAHKIMQQNRQRKYKCFLSKLNPGKSTRILDVGPNEFEYSPFDNFLEKNYPFVQNLSALGLGSLSKFHQRYPDVKAIIYNGKKFPFRDKCFDIIWSNAVLEHVGDEYRQIEFLKEIKRCAQKVFITTPNRFFPVEVHTRIPLLHWMPKSFFDSILRMLGKSWATGEYMNLLSKWQIKRLLFRAGIREYTIQANLIGPFTLDYIIIF